MTLHIKQFPLQSHRLGWPSFLGRVGAKCRRGMGALLCKCRRQQPSCGKVHGEGHLCEPHTSCMSLETSAKIIFLLLRGLENGGGTLYGDHLPVCSYSIKHNSSPMLLEALGNRHNTNNNTLSSLSVLTRFLPSA